MSHHLDLHPWPSAFSSCDLGRGFLFLEPPASNHLLHAAACHGRASYLDGLSAPAGAGTFAKAGRDAWHNENADRYDAVRALRCASKRGV